jgi:DNA-directed RNA polymerase specialized sigma24 family protein
LDSGREMSESTGQDSGTLRVTIREAAARLGVTEAAIKKRLQRGSLDKEMGEDERRITS